SKKVYKNTILHINKKSYNNNCVENNNDNNSFHKEIDDNNLEKGGNNCEKRDDYNSHAKKDNNRLDDYDYAKKRNDYDHVERDDYNDYEKRDNYYNSKEIDSDNSYSSDINIDNKLSTKDKGIMTITKEIQKISLYPTTELFKDHLESYVDNVPEIKTNAGTKIAKWKKNPHVSEAYDKLWEVDDNNLTTINTISSKNDIVNIQDDSRDESNAIDYNDNNIEEHSENDTDE
ncbi:22651_t:CDS:2, partial [Gigaspora margarita]